MPDNITICIVLAGALLWATIAWLSNRTEERHRVAILRAILRLGEAATGVDLNTEASYLLGHALPTGTMYDRLDGLERAGLVGWAWREFPVDAEAVVRSSRRVWAVTVAGREWLAAHAEESKEEGQEL